MGAAVTLKQHDDKMQLRQRMLDHIATRRWDEKMNGELAEQANSWALAHGYDLITVEQVDRFDSLASGHIDWAQKLALSIADYCVYRVKRGQ